jgi:hypothetical protein
VRDVVGVIALVLAVAAAIALIVGLLRRKNGPSDAEPSGAGGRRTLVIVAAVACGVFAALAAALLIPAHYTVTVQTKGETVAGPASKLTAQVKNHGLLSGTFHATYLVDGTSQGEVRTPAPAGATRTIDLPLPSAIVAGPHTVTVAGTTTAFRALRPAAFHVSSLQLVPPAGRVKDPVVVTAGVTNTGEATGVFPGVLRVNGRPSGAAKPVTIAGGSVKSVFYQVTRARPGWYTFRLGDSRPSTIPIVKPVRPATGTVLARATSGTGRLTFQNKMADDCVCVLAASAKGTRHPALAFYVRARSSATLNGIADGGLYVYFTSGTGWNRTTRDFLETSDRERFKHPAVFSTSRWTTSYTDWSAWTRYTTRHTQYTIWTIKVSEDYVSGPSGGVVRVSAARFPKY